MNCKSGKKHCGFAKYLSTRDIICSAKSELSTIKDQIDELSGKELSFEELSYEINDLYHIYCFCLAFNSSVHLTFDSSSLVLVKNQYAPYPRICISPYAFIQGYINTIVKSDVSINHSFAYIFLLKILIFCFYTIYYSP